MNQIDNLKALFTGTDKEAIQALKEKCNWINHEFLIPGNLDQHTDEAGKTHYTLIEALYDGVFIFDEIHSDLEGLTTEQNQLVTDTCKDFAKLTLYSYIDKEIDTDFWCEFDFKKLEKHQYSQLFPNFYNSLPLWVMKLDLNSKNLMHECMKCLIAGPAFQDYIILSKNDLLNLRYHCPILSKIYVKKGIDPELLETLTTIARKYEAEIEELEDEQQ